MKPKGKNLFIISGPSGSGKDAVISQMRHEGFKFAQIVTITTRRKRKGEYDGNPYYFVSKEEFLKLKNSRELIEWAEVYGDYYGSTKKEAESKLARFPLVIHKIDCQGARAMKKLYPAATVIFILPGAREVLEGRVAQRKTDTTKSKELRRQAREKEFKNLDQWDEVVINKEGELDQTAVHVKTIIKNKIARQRKNRIAILTTAILILFLGLVAVLFVPSQVKEHQLKKEFANYLDYLAVVPANAVYLVASNNGLAENFLPSNLGQKGFLFLDRNNNSALIIKNNDQAALSEMIRKFWGYKYPSTRAFSLPDGSYGYEYFSNLDQFELKSSELSGTTVNSIVDNERRIQLSWATFSGLSVISTEISPIKNTVEKSASQEKFDLESLNKINCAEIDKALAEETDQKTYFNLPEDELNKLACFQID